MNYLELKSLLKESCGAERLKGLYGGREGMRAEQLARFQDLIAQHQALYQATGDVLLISAPGRTEIIGNHTDHNAGKVLAAAVNLDTLAAVSRRDDMRVRLSSAGYAPLNIDLTDLSPKPEEVNTTAGLIRGVADRMAQLGYKIGGFDAAVTSQVRIGSGLSSSAAFEVMICCALDNLYNDGGMDPVLRAKVSQYAENVHFGKPSGLMDQTASSVGGMTGIDFRGEEPEVGHLAYDFEKEGYALVVVAPGGSHGDLTDDYAAIRNEMLDVAKYFGKDVLRQVEPDQFYGQLKALRAAVSDRAVLRAMHFFSENERVTRALSALKAHDTALFLKQITLSGQSSWEKLQNMSASAHDQPLALAIALAEGLLKGEGACRLHGGGFAGTTLNFVPLDQVDAFACAMEAVFGEGCCDVLSVRDEGACRVF